MHGYLEIDVDSIGQMRQLPKSHWTVRPFCLGHAFRSTWRISCGRMFISY